MWGKNNYPKTPLPVKKKLLQEMMDVWISSNASFLMSSPAILQAHYKKYRIFIAENNKKR